MRECYRFLVSVLSLLAILSFMGGLSTIVIAAQSTPVLTVYPLTDQAASIGQTVPILVYIYTATNVTGYQFQLNFNVTLLQCVSASIGNWFPSPPNSTSTVTVDNTNGIVSIQAYLTSGTAPLSVVGTFHGQLLSVSFNATYGTQYPRPNDSCTLGITNDAVYGIGNQTIQPIVQNGVYVAPYAQPNLGLALTLSQTKYYYDAAVFGNVNLTSVFTANGYPLPDSLVAVEILGPNGLPVVARTFPTSNASMSLPLQIAALIPCDQFGDPQSTFQVNGQPTIIYFNVTVQNVGSTGQTGVTLVNPYDASNATLGVGYFEFSLAAGETLSQILQFTLPYNTNAKVLTMPTSGSAMVYASVWSNSVEAGGSPLSLEASAPFTITGTPSGIPTVTNQSATGTCQDIWMRHFSSGLYSASQPPNYTIHVEAQYMGNLWAGKSQTNTVQAQITICGDINKDGKVSLSDLALLAVAYNSHPGKSNWNPNADINGDGVVNLSDLALLARNYGKGQ